MTLPMFLRAQVVCVVSVGLCAAADWPRWRGPNRDGIAPENGLMKKWPAEGPPLLWQMRGAGRGYSSMSIVGNRLFTMGDLPDGGKNSQFIIAFDLESRKAVWTAKVGPPHSDGSRCTPTVADGLVYAIGTDGDLVCVQAADGKEVWRRNFGRDFGGRMMSGWRYSESPLVDGERVICTPGGPQAALAALDRKTGEITWKCAPPPGEDMGGAGYASVVISHGAGVKQYVTVMGRGAIGVAADNGRFLWKYGRIANRTANIPTPACDGDYVFVSTAYNTGAACLKLSKSDGGVKAEEVYFLRPDVFQCHHGGFVLIGKHIFGAHGHNAGNPICIELATGNVVWRERQLGRGSGALLAADGCLYYRYEDNTISVVEASPQQYRLLSSFKAPASANGGGPGWSHLVILDGRLYMRHNDIISCFDLRAK